MELNLEAKAVSYSTKVVKGDTVTVLQLEIKPEYGDTDRLNALLGRWGSAMIEANTAADIPYKKDRKNDRQTLPLDDELAKYKDTGETAEVYEDEQDGPIGPDWRCVNCGERLEQDQLYHGETGITKPVFVCRECGDTVEATEPLEDRSVQPVTFLPDGQKPKECGGFCIDCDILYRCDEGKGMVEAHSDENIAAIEVEVLAEDEESEPVEAEPEAEAV